MLAREPGSSKAPRRLRTAQPTASVGRFMPAREPASSKGLRLSTRSTIVGGGDVTNLSPF